MRMTVKEVKQVAGVSLEEGLRELESTWDYHVVLTGGGRRQWHLDLYEHGTVYYRSFGLSDPHLAVCIALLWLDGVNAEVAAVPAAEESPA